MARIQEEFTQGKAIKMIVSQHVVKGTTECRGTILGLSLSI
jgi:hypothetical protein